MTDTYDLIAIGAGPAGESATELASFFGHRSAIVERNRPGGTVTTTGGVPTKTLREAALYLWLTGARDLRLTDRSASQDCNRYHSQADVARL